MRVLVLNAVERKGNKKATGEPYSMYFVSIGLPFNNVDFSSFKESGYGVNIAEIPLEPAAFPKFSFLNGKPAYMELVTTEKIVFGELKTVVIDAKVSSMENKVA